MITTIAWVVAAAAAVLSLVLAVRALRLKQQTAQLETAVADGKQQLAEIQRQAAARDKEAELAAKEVAIQAKQEAEKELRQRRRELAKLENRLDQREEAVEGQRRDLDKSAKEVVQQQRQLVETQQELQGALEAQRTELERISRLTTDEARGMLLRQVEEEAREDMSRLVRQIEEEAREEADRRAAWVVGMAIQRCAVEHARDATVSVVAIPSDDMKGRIIGREGRNIRTFEQLTGVDLIIDDTPEAVVISAFDPIRREVAKVALQGLISDGRIHPARIEELVERAQRTTEERVKEAGEKAVFETGTVGLHPELVRLLGVLTFRTSYGQNVLAHSIEVAHLSAVMAAEIGANEAIARRAGLLHDIGKAKDFQMEGTHAAIGADLARQRREHPDVVRAIAAHHGDIEMQAVEDVLVQAADAVSASRPGARGESLENYLRRLEGLEQIASSFDGVEKCYAIQAGREIRVMVVPEKVDDLGAHRMAKGVAEKIEQELDYPGQIRVTVIRETRAVEHAN